ncbi:unnamed protein product [Caenorhabditis brenneri]
MKLLLFAFALFVSAFGQFSETAQNTIVEIHNDLRSKVALGEVEIGGTQHSPATNMIKIRWSPASARTAQNYANTCPDAPSGLPNVGENLYFEYSKKKPTSLDKFEYRIVVVCHYREMGNVIDDPIYEEGEVCTNCPAFRSCEEETGLCL